MHKPGKNTSVTLLGNSAYIFLIRFFPSLASLMALVLFSRYTEPAFYGRYQAFWVQWQVLNTVACLGLPALIFTYPLSHVTGLIRGLNAGQKARFIGWFVLVAAAFALLQLANGYALFHPVLIAVFLWISTLISLVEAYLMLGRRFNQVALISCLYSVLFMVVHWLFIKEELSLELLFMILIAGNMLRLAYLLFAGRSLYRGVSDGVQALKLNSIKSLWFHLGVYDLVQMLFRWVDKLVLGFLLTAPVFALYFNGTIDVPFLPLLLGAAGSALLMQLSQQETTDSVRIDLLKESSSLLSRIVFPVFLFLILFRHELFGVVFNHKYDAAVPLFLIATMVVPLRAYNFTSILQHKGRGRIINTGAVLDLAIALILMYPLYRIFSLSGIAFAFVLSTWLQAGFYLYHTAKILHVKWYRLLPLYDWLKQLIVFSVVFIGLYYVLHNYLEPATSLFLGGGALALVIIVSLLPVLLSKRNP